MRVNSDGSVTLSDGITVAPFSSSVRVEDGDDAFNSNAEIIALLNAAPDGEYTTIWRKTVPAQTLYRWGTGSPAFPDNQGYIAFAAVKTTATTGFQEGKLLLRITSATEIRQIPVAEYPTQRLHTNTATVAGALSLNRQDLQALPSQNALVQEDSRLELAFKPQGSSVTVTDVLFNIPVTIFQ